MNKLNDRKKQILDLVIKEYIRSGKPVSSQYICDNYGLDYSPATIRNDLASLERDGYLTHPHTSAGRVPTDDGYRYYIDFLMEIQKLTKDEEKRVNSEFNSRIKELDKIMAQTSKMLAAISECAGFVIAQNIKESKINYLELAKLAPYRFLLLIVTEDSLVKHKVIQSKFDIETGKIYNLNVILNNKFKGKSVSSLKENVLEIIIEEQKEQELFSLFLNNIVDDLTDIFETEICYLEENFSLRKKIDVRDSFENIFQDDKFVKNLFSDLSKITDGVKIYIPETEESGSVRNYSLIASTYKIGDDAVGALGIIGPKRMNYNKMASFVDYITKVLNKILKEK